MNSDNRKLSFERFSVVSADGTRLMAYKIGNGPKRWLLPPGLGTPVTCWRRIGQTLGDSFTLLTWDLRGTFSSEPPADIRRLGMDDHLHDAQAVAQAAAWFDGAGFVLGGWSLGIEISLELYRRHSDQVRALVLINGSFEHILRSALGLPHADTIFTGITQGLLKAAPLLTPTSRYLLSREWTLRLLTTLGIVAATDDQRFFVEMLREFTRLDFVTYFRLMLAANEHSARDVLPTITVPTLITAGSKDNLTPLAISREMHALIPTSELFVIPGGTHYTIVEYPEIVNLKLTEFFARVFAEKGG